MRWWVIVMSAGCAATGSEGVITKAERPTVVVATSSPTSTVDLVEDGHHLFTHSWTAGDSLLRGGGVDTHFRNAESCGACHSMGGVGGAGRRNVSAFGPLSILTRTIFLGTLDRGLVGASTVNVSDSSVAQISLRPTTRRAPPIPMRNTPALFGDALIDGIEPDTIRALAATSYPEHPEVTGRVAGARESAVGRFGWKGQTASLAEFVAGACSNELGLSVPDPVEREGETSMDRVQLASMVAFVASLPAPEVPVLTTVEQRGEYAFSDVGCATCHTPTVSGAMGIYSDLLLHDMGAALAEPEPVVGYYGAAPVQNPALNVAGLSEWRTPPLWGVADSPPYLHDGRAETLADAIALHGGEAHQIRRAYQALPVAEKDAILAFLGSLRTPVSVLADSDECLSGVMEEPPEHMDVVMAGRL